MQYVIKYYLIIISLLLFNGLTSQQIDLPVEGEKKNIIKLNLSGFVWKNLSVQYERKIGQRYSFAFNAHFIPFGSTLFETLAEKIINDTSVKISQFKFGNVGLAPEFRCYVGKKGALRGFYVGVFVSYNQYTSDFPIAYQSGRKTGVFTGSLNAYTVGVQLGAQFKLSKHFYLDWWIIGPNIGNAKGKFSFNTALSASDQLSVRDEIENLNNILTFKVIDSYTVNANGAEIIANGPWGGTRALGINIGYRF
jgi:hypothetical protein